MEERHRHRYEVNTDYVARLEEKGLKFVGHDTENVRMEVKKKSKKVLGKGTYSSRR